jgi:choline-sulfatase
MPKPANFLFIMTDQHNPAMMSCNGHPVVKTPNIDKLAARGTRFQHAYTPCPICVPARSALATGRYPHQLDCWDNAKPYIGTEAPSWGHRLTEAGHAVVTIGKLHYRDPRDDTGFPDQRIPLHVHEGEGDAFGLLRERMPPRRRLRMYMEEAGGGDSEYIRYDRAIAQAARQWLTEEAPAHGSPWALMVSFVCPHMPLIAPPEYMAMYPPESIALPTNWDAKDWPSHPAIDFKRFVHRITPDNPLDEESLRRGIAAYYALCTFVDDQIGIVLDTLEEQGLADSTRVVYTSDHGDMMGEHGLWFKSCMYEGSVGIPMIVAGPDVPAGKVSRTGVSLIDVFPSALECVDVEREPEDADLPGVSLFELAGEPMRRTRAIYSEYHASASICGFFMIRGDRYKYVYYPGYPAQLFDLDNDPRERRDLASDPAYADVVAQHHAMLLDVCDPDAVDARARADQKARLDAHGGADQVLARGPKFTHSPPPRQFQDEGAARV